MVAKNRKQFEVKLGKTGVSLLAFGMAAGLFVTFLFGVTVGKNIDTYPAAITGYLPGIAGEWLGWKAPPAPVALGGAKKETAPPEGNEFDLTFYDTLSKKKEGDIILQRPGVPTPSAPDALPPPASPPAARPPATSVPGAAKPASAGQTQPPAGVKPPESAQARHPAPPAAASVPGAAKTAPAGPAAKPVAGKDRFLVQLASYQEKAKAEQLNKKLAALGYRARVEAVEVPGKGTWYRVALGGFDSVESAKGASAAVSTKVPGVQGVVRREK
ncbi:MAG TPA: SPOR domain-containing protein [Syntrophales bacterium]|nr:SPOR domain-containing protein [Syntrophales bacterium]